MTQSLSAAADIRVVNSGIFTTSPERHKAYPMRIECRRGAHLPTVIFPAAGHHGTAQLCQNTEIKNGARTVPYEVSLPVRWMAHWTQLPNGILIGSVVLHGLQS